ncbi:MAG: hypothetical protein V1875_04530 [Candidatus Altiarchaeota archaeon]
MERFIFYRISRDCGKIVFDEAGRAWYEVGRGTVVESQDAALAKLLSNPVDARRGGSLPRRVGPDEREFLAEAAYGLFDSGYIGRVEDKHA